MKSMGWWSIPVSGRSRPAWGAWIEMSLHQKVFRFGKSRPAWGAWIEIFPSTVVYADGRAPHGARGLKFCLLPTPTILLWSRPAWGAWIEITGSRNAQAAGAGRAPHGARGLKCQITWFQHFPPPASRPAWGAWIEIYNPWQRHLLAPSRPAWGAWIEISKRKESYLMAQSRPAWGAWIEIPISGRARRRRTVAPRMGRVD